MQRNITNYITVRLLSQTELSGSISFGCASSLRVREFRSTQTCVSSTQGRASHLVERVPLQYSYTMCLNEFVDVRVILHSLTRDRVIKILCDIHLLTPTLAGVGNETKVRSGLSAPLQLLPISSVPQSVGLSQNSNITYCCRQTEEFYRKVIISIQRVWPACIQDQTLF